MRWPCRVAGRSLFEDLVEPLGGKVGEERRFERPLADRLGPLELAAQPIDGGDRFDQELLGDVELPRVEFPEPLGQAGLGDPGKLLEPLPTATDRHRPHDQENQPGHQQSIPMPAGPLGEAQPLDDYDWLGGWGLGNRSGWSRSGRSWIGWSAGLLLDGLGGRGLRRGRVRAGRFGIGGRFVDPVDLGFDVLAAVPGEA